MMMMMMMMMRYNVEPAMWKRDTRTCFRSIPARVEDYWCVYVVFVFSGYYYAALQYGMPFGCIAAVVAFHRFSNLLEHVICNMLKAPLA